MFQQSVPGTREEYVLLPARGDPGSLRQFARMQANLQRNFPEPVTGNALTSERMRDELCQGGFARTGYPFDQDQFCIPHVAHLSKVVLICQEYCVTRIRIVAKLGIEYFLHG